MSFQFNFLSNDDSSASRSPETSACAEYTSTPLVEIKCPPIDNMDLQVKNLISYNDLSITILADHDEDRISDLIPGEYEGGKKIWECSLDLARYVLESFSGEDCADKTVLELGCGHGIPGIAALKCGFQRALFSDYNDYVLSLSTWPTIVRNDIAESKVQSFAGDWAQLSSCLTNNTISAPEKFDLILSAETLYTAEALEKVYQFVINHLSSPNGVALIASKRYYFGVGGGVRDFLKRIKEGQSSLEYDVVRSFDDGCSNIRDIVKVRWR